MAMAIIGSAEFHTWLLVRTSDVECETSQVVSLASRYRLGAKFMMNPTTIDMIKGVSSARRVMGKAPRVSCSHGAGPIYPSLMHTSIQSQASIVGSNVNGARKVEISLYRFAHFTDTDISSASRSNAMWQLVLVLP